MQPGCIPCFSYWNEKYVNGKIENMSVKDIEQAITRLPKQELTELIAWLEDYRHQVWDKQIEDDLDTGRLDALLAEAEEEYEADSAQPL